MSPPLQRPHASCISISQCQPNYYTQIFFFLTKNFPSWLPGVCWRSPSESRPFWGLCRPAGPNPSSWRRWRRWSPLQRSNSWRRCGFTSTSEPTGLNWRPLRDATSVCWSFHSYLCFFLPLQVGLGGEPGWRNHLSPGIVRHFDCHQLRVRESFASDVWPLSRTAVFSLCDWIFSVRIIFNS